MVGLSLDGSCFSHIIDWKVDELYYCIFAQKKSIFQLNTLLTVGRRCGLSFMICYVPLFYAAIDLKLYSSA